jgi:hypothetical protein
MRDALSLLHYGGGWGQKLWELLAIYKQQLVDVVRSGVSLHQYCRNCDSMHSEHYAMTASIQPLTSHDTA